MATSLKAASAAMDPLMAAYYNQQERNASDTYQIGLAQNQEQKAQTDLSYQQKMNALQDKLGQQWNALPNSYAARGLMNSGIWNWNGAGQLGAKQQFAYDQFVSGSNLAQQQNQLDQQYGQKGLQLGTQYNDQLAGIKTQQAADMGRQAVSDAIAGA